jgi:hypothetical protein
MDEDSNPEITSKEVDKKTTKAEEKLKKIADVYNKEYKVKGQTVMTHMGYNLQGAIIDLKNGKNDKVIIDTLERVGKQIAEIAKIIGPDLIWEKEIDKLGKGGK